MYTLLSMCYKYLLTRPLKIKTKQVHLIIAETLWSILVQNLHVLLKKNTTIFIKSLNSYIPDCVKNFAININLSNISLVLLSKAST